MRTERARPGPFKFGTKAETLERLTGLSPSAPVLELFYFEVARWRGAREGVLDELQRRFPNGPLAVRSSAIGEDGPARSHAGAYRSLLGVEAADRSALASAVDSVVASYRGNPLDQVLVQPMLANVVMSGVVMTRNLDDGGPYYSINYDDETGSTSSVTAGNRVNKTVHIFHEAPAKYVHSARIQAVLAMARALEEICGDTALDVEFGLTAQGELYVFQVRRISVWKEWSPRLAEQVAASLPHVEKYLSTRGAARPGLVGTKTVLGNMPDWNPAEMIGTVPGHLALSLYRELITRGVWRRARELMGYRPVHGEELMVVLGGRPYIDVRNSFNSLLPSTLEDETAGRLVHAWLEKLEERPDLHDKVEFEVATTCQDFEFDSKLDGRYPGLLSGSTREKVREAYRNLTHQALSLSAEGSLPRAERAVRALEERQAQPTWCGASEEADGRLQRAVHLVQECRRQGTVNFAILARHAFIAETLLRSAVSRGALSSERLVGFKRSIRTITTELSEQMAEVARGVLDASHFMRRFGHLRPGTYDIKSIPYRSRDDIFTGMSSVKAPDAGSAPFSLDARERRALEALLSEAGLPIEVDGLFEYARRAIIGREWAKFVFSRSLSAALENLAQWGKQLGLSREHVSHISFSELGGVLQAPPLRDLHAHFLDLAERGAEEAKVARALKLSFLILDVDDLYVVPSHRTVPNFVGKGAVRGPIALLGGDASVREDLFGRIVCIENADPGFDFIFGKGISALVTKYGGANSHMAIRCTELGIPAAIGCGDQTFERIAAAGSVELDCDAHVLRPLDDRLL